MPTHVNSFNETRETLTWLNPPILAPPLTERCFRSTPKGVLTAQDYGVAVVGSWQISQRPLTVHKGEWGDRGRGGGEGRREGGEERREGGREGGRERREKKRGGEGKEKQTEEGGGNGGG